jgi:hypothetical protein
LWGKGSKSGEIKRKNGIKWSGGDRVSPCGRAKVGDLWKNHRFSSA